ncbi:glycosyltransferase [Kosakonia sp.]|uniref:glycosyltransferase n=1 Tax=Kosakonia sp. TaxID=1916651 RepID=UPI00289B4CA0|nr:glycosyltransferase [Kosakonia sp.]
MNEHALVSIIIPAYKPDFFETALCSALNQSWPNCEIIISDDSRDDTIRLISERYAREAATPIKYFKNETALGEENNTLRCVREAQGHYIKFLYDDDILFEHCITRLVNALESAPGNRLATSRRLRVDEYDKPLADIVATAAPFAEDVILDGRDVIAYFADTLVNFIGEPSVILCYRDDLLAFGEGLFLLKGEAMPFLADMTISLKLLALGNLAFVAETLSAFRISGNQQSQLNQTRQDQVTRTYTRMPIVIRELGWYKGDTEQNQWVNVAPMHAPTQFSQQNLHHAMLLSAQRSLTHFRSGKIHEWLAGRTLPAQYRPLVEAFQEARGTTQTLTVFVFQPGNNTAACEKTLASIAAYQSVGLTISPVVICENPQAAPATAPTLICPYALRATAVNQYIAARPGDWLLCLDAGETLQSSGMLMFDLALDSAAGCDAVYGDAFYQAADGELTGSAFRPDFNLDLLLSYPSEMARHWIFRSATLLELGGFNTEYQQAWQFDYIVRLIEQKGIQFAGHLPEIFVIAQDPQQMTQAEEVAILTRHLHHRGYPQGRVEAPKPGLYALRYQHEQQPLVSIIIPTKDQLSMLIPCVTSLLEKTRYANYELLIVDNNSETPEALQWLEGLSTIDPQRIRVLRYPYPFNYSAINNMAAREARGEYLVLLNNDTAIISANWLDNLLNHGLRPEVGITGAKLLYPTSKVQHAGVVLGLRGPADHPFIGSESERSGYMNRLQVDQNYNVVTAACLLIRKSVYDQVGGLDEEKFKVSYNDVDLCLKVREAGYLTVWTPHAMVMHEGSVSQNKVDKTAQEKKRIRFIGEQDAMYEKWMPLIASDPAYNPNLTLEGEGFQFTLGEHDTWQPLHWKPLPRFITYPLSDHQETQQRLVQPLDRLKAAALADGQNAYRATSFAEIVRYAPDALILSRQCSPFLQEWLQRLRKVTQVFTVFDIDEYLPALPAKSPLREKFPADFQQVLRGTVASADRLVVASDVLAETCAGWNHDIRVVPTRLDPAQWARLTSLRGIGQKPRVGWVGSAERSADLDVIYPLISQLADRVDWIFFGYCPPALRPYLKEYHASWSSEVYAQRLASLNLDLALAPLADNLFNRNLSPLRLLEYGACGYAVICSDNICYRNDLPVTRVASSAKKWREAIEMHLHDLPATWKQGDALQAWVREHGMLRGENLLQHARSWLPDA